MPLEPPSFDELAAFARSVIAGHEPHTGVQCHALILAEAYLRLHEIIRAKPKPHTLSRERGSNPYPEDAPS